MAYLLLFVVIGYAWALRTYAARLLQVTTAAFAGSRARLLFERNLMVYRRSWMIIFSGVFEPLFYLFSMGIGLGHFVGKVPGPGGELVDYASFVAPALLASAAMNGAIYDATNVFWKLKYMRTYDAVLSTPIGPADVAVGETAWALFRGFLYAISFMAVAGVLGLIESPWGLLALPAAVADRIRIRGSGRGRHDVHAHLAGLRADRPRPAPDVPLLGDLLPDHDVSRTRSSGSSASRRSTTPSSSCVRSTSGRWAGLSSSTSPICSSSGPAASSSPSGASGSSCSSSPGRCYPVRRPQPRLSAYFRRVAGTDDDGGEMGLTKEVKQEIVQQHGASQTDTGSTKVQVALLTKRINDLTEHLRAHPKDHYSRRGLLKLVGRRRRFLTYLQKHDLEGYRALIKELGLRR